MIAGGIACATEEEAKRAAKLEKRLFSAPASAVRSGPPRSSSPGRPPGGSTSSTTSSASTRGTSTPACSSASAPGCACTGWSRSSPSWRRATSPPRRISPPRCCTSSARRRRSAAARGRACPAQRGAGRRGDAPPRVRGCEHRRGPPRPRARRSSALDVEVRDRPDRPRPERAHLHAGVEQRRDQRGRVLDLEHDDVRRDGRGIELDPGHAREPAGELTRQRVIVGEPLDVVVERVQRAGGDDPRLAHRAAPHLLVAPRLVDQRPRARQARADRRARAPSRSPPTRCRTRRSTTPRASRSPPPRSSAARRPCAAAVRPRARPRPRRRAARAATRARRSGSSSARPTRAASAAGSDRPRAAAPSRSASAVNIPRSPSSGHSTAPEIAAGPPASATIGCERPVQVGLVAGRPDVQPERDRVAHRPAGQEHGRLEAEQLGHPLAERVDGRVGERLLVADLGGGHRLRASRRSAGSACRSRS